MTFPASAAVFGLGLMGGSLARDLAARGTRVLATDRRADVLDAALSSGVVAASLRDDLADLATVELVVVATPVDAAVQLLEPIADATGADVLVTDLGSTKREICRRALELGLGDRFVGSHPLAGDHRSGWEAARSGLYASARVFLCDPRPAPPPDARAARRIEALWRGLGAFPVAVPPERHDREMAWISHLPQVVASALAVSLDAAGHPAAELGRGGRDMTRLAASSASMWVPICLENSDHLDAALGELQQRLSAFGDLLRTRDRAGLFRFFATASDWLADPPDA